MASDKSFTDSFIHADPARALEELNVALGEKADNAEWLCQRAYAHILLKDYNRAADDAKKAQELQPGMALAFLRTGIAEYHLNNIRAAHQAFTAGKGVEGANEDFQTWIKKCEEKMATQDQNGTSDLQTAASHVKHDWYQTESQVTITLMVKNVKKEDVSVTFKEKELKAWLKLPSGEDYCLNIHLLHPVVPEQSTYRIFSTKISVDQQSLQNEPIESAADRSSCQTSR
ncbi:protein SGT1 homolog [Tachysurus ichikawai]